MSQKRFESRWMNPKEAANYLNCSVHFLNKDRITRIYGIPFSRLGRLIKYNVDDLNAFLERNRENIKESL